MDARITTYLEKKRNRKKTTGMIGRPSTTDSSNKP